MPRMWGSLLLATGGRLRGCRSLRLGWVMAQGLQELAAIKTLAANSPAPDA